MRLSVLSGILMLSIGCSTPSLGFSEDEAHAGAKELEGIESISKAQARLSLDLIDRLAKVRKSGGVENVVVSPASLAAVFALLDQGADKPMRAAMLSTLGFVPSGSSDPTATFDTLRSARALLGKDTGEALHVADKLVLDPSVEPYPIVRSAIATQGAEISTDDLSKPEAVARINEWVKENTAGLIPSILDGPLDRPALVALDALHFKGRWQSRFDPEATKPAPFTDADHKTVQATMMHLPEGKHAFRSQGEFIGVDLPFEGGRFSLTVVTTAKKPAKPDEFVKIADWLSGTGFVEQSGDLVLPRLTLSAGMDLVPVLDSLGLEKGRKSPTAFGGFAPGASLSRIVQRVTMKVDEEGAEAAAATAVTATRAFEGSPVHMVVDKPFVFVLRDRKSGLILVAGYIARPPVDTPRHD